MKNICNFEKHFGIIFCSFWGMVIAMSACNNVKESSLKVSNTEVDTTKTTVSPFTSEPALKFINAYVQNCNKLKLAEEIVTWANHNQFTSQNFNMALKKLIENANQKDPELGLGFDPIFNAQDYPQDGFELDHIDPLSNTVVVQGKNMPTFKLIIQLVFERKQWLVDGCGAVNIPQNQNH